MVGFAEEMTKIKKQHFVSDSIRDFWFNQIDQEKWFRKDIEFDKQVDEKFRPHVEWALNGNYEDWNDDFSSRLSLILLLDQMTRNIFRDTPKAFAGDAAAIALTFNAISDGQLDSEKEEPKRQFLLMPLMHSEDIKIQDQSIPFFEKYTGENTILFAGKHRDIIAEFGRYPHRNALLGRPSTKEEIEFLKRPDSGF